ncbi:hypothetical protein [Pseudomonas sp. URMO17WK12:I12]|jgi:hypothetical protein|uniref:hypothetical protein n=1 Tax=Pseudomonas sp. URMO17WK12:I12 TaxID=1259797 RepID=UPI000486B577|nr:hypothetical protein [Pseudomonas sp. URMO17WK12:I12]
MLDFNYAVYIDGGSVLLLSHELSARECTDVLDSTLFMQLAAAAEQPGLDGYEQWWGGYRSQLNKFGWSRIQDFEGSFRSDPDLLPQTVSQAVASKVRRFLSAEYVDAVGRAFIEVSRLSPHHLARTLLRYYSIAEDPVSKLTTVRLQFGIVVAGARLIYLTVSFITREAFSSSIIEQNFLTDDIVGEIEFKGCVAVLDSAAYDSWRGRIAMAVAPFREEQIRAVSSPNTEW